MIKRVFIALIFNCLCFLFTIHAQIHNYYPNPGRGYMSGDKALTYRVANFQKDSKSYFTATLFRYIYLSEIFTNECINSRGKLDEEKIYNNIKNYFDSFLNTNSKTRFVLRIFPNNEGNSTRVATLVNSKKTKDGHLYIWMPTNMYNIIEKSKYPTIIGKAIYPKYFKTSDNVAILDYNNPLVQKVYDTILRLFSKYLQEEIQAPHINSDTNVSPFCKRGDLIYCIEMGFVGSWGEGITTDYINYKSSKALIQIAELYKKYLFEYLLIAPSFGMRTNTTKNNALHEFQEYLLTTTYGSRNKDKNGLYYGHREFGLFMDHLGSSDYLNDFNLTIKNQSIKDIAKNKYKRAPFIGENSGQFNSEKDLILKNISDYGVSLAHLWNAVPLDSIKEDAANIWKTAANNMGYAFYVNIPKGKTYIKNGILNTFFTLTNKGSSKLYLNMWLPQLVIRNQEGEIKQIINIDKELDLKSIEPTLIKNVHFETIINIKKKVSSQFDNMNIFLRFVDRKHINENMFLINQKRTINGEYLLVL